jgi:hypothetical protein
MFATRGHELGKLANFLGFRGQRHDSRKSSGFSRLGKFAVTGNGRHAAEGRI